MKRILFLHHAGHRGGAGIMLANILRTLDRERFQPIVVSPPGDIVGDLESTGAEVRIAPRPIRMFRHTSGFTWPAYSPDFLKDAILQWQDRGFWEQYFRQSGVDMVQLSSLVLAPLGVAARRAGLPVVCLVQETLTRGVLGVRTTWLRHLLSRQMDAVVFISEFDRRQAHCRAPITEAIPNWVDLAVFDRSLRREDARQTLGLPMDAEIIFFLGGMSKLKGTLILLRAVNELRGRKNLHLVIAGYNAPLTRWLPSDVPRIYHAARRMLGSAYRATNRALGRDYLHRTMTFLSRMDHADRVHLVGMTENIVPYYAAADVVVFPATAAHQARPVLEAGAMAKPVVVSDFECLREFVTHGRNGLVFPPGDWRALAQALRQLFDDPEQAKLMGEENYRNTCEQHDARVNGPRFNALYERVLSAQHE